MASLQNRRPQNVDGDFYVDSTCIDCDTCRWMAPQTFQQADGQSAVCHQPTSQAERLAALQALLSCPTASIGTVATPTDIIQAQASLPIPIEDTVYHCGYHAEASYAAASYLIQRPQGNVLVDSPRFTPPLVKRLEAMGGVRYLYLTHRDDIADHQKFRDHFGCDRILHADDISPIIQDIEIQITGVTPQSLADDLLIIPVPGHTQGHTVLLYRHKFLFTGDHLAWSAYLNHLYAFQRYCWYSWSQQIDSMKRLMTYDFEWILPGHGRRYHAALETMGTQLQKCISWMENA
jgi:glyoxylase-like metal-dependent hydrolase (beta-lactamase superfamily II)/ferredoxin